MWKRGLVGFLLCLMVMAVKPAYAEIVTVSLPDYAITLNGEKVQNDSRRYPFLDYRGTMYIPMTYYDSRFLGLEANPGYAYVFSVDKTGITVGYREFLNDTPNPKQDQATVVLDGITINGNASSLYTEGYPILFYRDIHYIPLNWKLEREFSWMTSFSDAEGLILRTTNAAMHPVYPPQFSQEESNVVFSKGYKDILLDKGQLYYTGQDGIVYRTPVSNPANAEKLVQMPLEQRLDSDEKVCYQDAVFAMKGAHPWILNRGMRIQPNGTVHKLVNIDGRAPDRTMENSDYIIGESGRLTVWADVRRLDPKNGQNISKGNLTLMEEGKTPKAIGDPGYIYGVLKQGDLFSNEEKLTIVGRDIYINAYHPAAQFSTLCQVNMDSKETTKLVHNDGSAITQSAIAGNILYYLHQEGSEQAIYRRSLQSTRSEKVPLNGINNVSELIAVGDTVFFYGTGDGQSGYRNIKMPSQCLDKLLYRDPQREEMRYAPYVSTEQRVWSENGYFIFAVKRSRFASLDDIDYRLMIFDQNNNLVFKSADLVDDISIDQYGNIAYVLYDEPGFYIGKLAV